MVIAIEKLQVNEYHQKIYQTNDIDDLVKSIQEVGLLEKIVVNNTFIIISGYRRYLALKELGYKTVDVEISNVNPADELLTLISFNKQRVKTASELLNEIDFLYDIKKKKKRGRKPNATVVSAKKQNTRKEISDELGISEGTIYNLLYIRDNEPKTIEAIDAGKESINKTYQAVKNKEKRAKIVNFNTGLPTEISNEYYTLYNKDSSNLSDLKSKSVQCVITSPPYWNLRKYSGDPNELGAEKTPELYIDRLANHLHQCSRVLKDDGVMFLNLGDTYFKKSLQMIPARVVAELCKKGWLVRNQIIWKKKNYTPSSCNDRFTPSYEMIYLIAKKRKYKYNQILLKAKTNDKRILSIQPKDKHYGETSHTSTSLSSGTKNIPDFWTNDILEVATANQHEYQNYGIKDHPAPFSEKLVELPILLTTNANDIVLDPFSGSGTVGAVALKEGRRYIGYDINSNFEKSVQLRLDSAIAEYNQRNQIKIAA